VAQEGRRKRFGLLLATIATTFAVQGIASPGRWEQLVVAVLLAGTLLVAVRVAESRTSVRRLMAGVAGALVAVALLEALVGNGNGAVARMSNLLLVTVTPPAVVVGVLRTLKAGATVTIEAVLGVLSLYLLLGMFFAFLYGLIGQLDGTFFAHDAPSTVARCLYFSFTTLTTVGYGDFTAASDLGHTLSVSEALLGQIYLVTIVSVIVGNLGMKRRSANETPAASAR
jgi:Ion channel